MASRHDAFRNAGLYVLARRRPVAPRRVTRTTALRIAEQTAPASTFEPHSRVSGRSVTSRTITFGTLEEAASSWTVPLSVRMHRASPSRRTKSKKPSGS